ncbi:unnamed protein product, partial [Sphagnum jensenii]
MLQQCITQSAEEVFGNRQVALGKAGWLPATATTPSDTSHSRSCDMCRYSSPSGLLSTQ